VPLVGSVHQVLGGGDAGPVRRAHQARSDRRVWAQCARLVVASELLAARLEADAIPREKMVVVVPGRDVTEPTGPVEPLGDLRQGRAAAVLCVANWQPRKGILELLDAVAALPADVATVHLVGDEAADPAYARRVRARLAERDVADRVVCHGIVAPASMGRWYEAADVFALASTEEPYGTVYGEAMIAGLPVVGWAAGNLVNLADDRVEGRVVALEDGAGLSAALREVCLDEALRARWGEAARRRAASLPTWQATAERFFAVCREAAASLAP
jgi:glycosyltransferase involved in cell wall biosynthesis